MKRLSTVLFCLFLLGASCARTFDGQRTLHSYEQVAAHYDARIALPRFETKPRQVESSVKSALAGADRRLQDFVVQDPAQVTFESSFAELDDILYPVINAGNRMSLMRETQPAAEMRAAAGAQFDAMQEWLVALQYREDVYRVCKAFDEGYRAGTQPRLSGEKLKLYQDTMRDYRRAGMELEPAQRAEVAELQNELNRLTTVFDKNITDAAVVVTFTAAELAGVPAGFLEASRQPDGSHSVRATVITDYLAVMQNAAGEETRKRLKQARYSVAMEENLPVLREIVALREQIAGKLGYASWADYRIEPRMAKQTARAVAFAEDLVRRLQPKFDAELEEYRGMKVADTGDPQAEIKIWDFRYYMNQLKKRKYQIDTEALRVFFPLEQVLAGMFDVYADIFRLEIARVHAPYAWAPEVSLYMVSDRVSGEPLGLFYFDPYPREGKYNHFAQFGIIDGKLLADGRYQRPVVALVCNFPAPGKDTPSLLAHADVETLFHEFGHALHTILTRAEFVTFSGTNTPQDFVEAPSQMLENWVWDPEVLNRFAADYRDPARKIDPAVLARLEEANLATQGTHYRRQLCFALTDLRIHQAGSAQDPAEVSNRTMAEVFLPPPENSCFSAYWGHLTGYDAGYYGYAWADSIAADMATAFERAPGGLMDEETGMRLRTEIYEVGGSRDVNESILKFLGRESTNEAFAESLGIQ